jgi:anaerobic C4-dicarboxylate transporter
MPIVTICGKLKKEDTKFRANLGYGAGQSCHHSESLSQKTKQNKKNFICVCVCVCVCIHMYAYVHTHTSCVEYQVFLTKGKKLGGLEVGSTGV